jgi:hypothetical protein
MTNQSRSPSYRWKIAELALNNNHSLTQIIKQQSLTHSLKSLNNNQSLKSLNNNHSLKSLNNHSLT